MDLELRSNKMTQSFDNAWKENRHVWESTKNLAKAMYLAGAQSRQAEIDELQKRVDGALKILDGMRHNGAYRAIDALKGEPNDN